MATINFYSTHLSDLSDDLRWNRSFNAYVWHTSAEVLEGAISCPGNSWAFFSATRKIPSPKCSLKQQAAKLYFFRGGEVKLLNLALWARMICSTLQLPSNRTHDQTFCSPSVKRSSSRWTRASLFAAAASPSTSTDPSGKTFRPGWTRSIESSPTGNGATTLPVSFNFCLLGHSGWAHASGVKTQEVVGSNPAGHWAFFFFFPFSPHNKLVVS